LIEHPTVASTSNETQASEVALDAFAYFRPPNFANAMPAFGCVISHTAGKALCRNDQKTVRLAGC
jgi:hypothetical protein